MSKSLQKVMQQIWLLCHTEMSVGVKHMANIPEMNCPDMWTKGLTKLKYFILLHKHQFDYSYYAGINASETYFHLGPVFVVWRLVLFVCGV